MSSQLFLALCFFFSFSASADTMPYGEKKKIELDSPNRIITHYHDWGGKPRTGYLSIKSKRSGSTIKSSSPPLTYLWQSPDEEYIVGLSNIKYKNKDQIVVWNKKGQVLFEKSIQCKNNDLNITHCAESGANLVIWYHEDGPGIRIESEENTLSLRIREAIRAECYLLDRKRLQQEEPDWLQELNCDQAPGEITIKIQKNAKIHQTKNTEK